MSASADALGSASSFSMRRAAHSGEGSTYPLDWLSHLASLRDEAEDQLTLPSHRRYLHYVGEILAGYYYELATRFS